MRSPLTAFDRILSHRAHYSNRFTTNGSSNFRERTCVELEIEQTDALVRDYEHICLPKRSFSTSSYVRLRIHFFYTEAFSCADRVGRHEAIAESFRKV